MVTTSLLIGSRESYPAQTLTIDGNSETLTSANLYLYHTTDSLSLLAQLVTLMTDAGLTNPAAIIGKDLKVHISADSSFTVTWGSATTLQTDLGFSQGNLAGASSYTAASQPRLLWSPGFRATSTSPLATTGYDVDDTVFTTSASGQTIVSTTTTTRVQQELAWASVAVARVWTTSEAGGEFKVFRDIVFYNNYRFFHWDGVTEDTTDSTEMDWGNGTELGPYKIRSPLINWFLRVNPTTIDSHSPIRLECTQTAEYS